MNHSVRIYTLISGLIFTPLTYWHSHYHLKPMLKFKTEEQMSRETETISVAAYNLDSCTHKMLIHDYQKRSENGELAQLRQIFDDSSLNFELKATKFDINLEDDKIDGTAFENLWDMAEDRKPLNKH